MSETYEFSLGNEKLRVSMNRNLVFSKNTWHCKRHSNADYELHIVLQGSCGLEVEDKHCSLQANQAIIIPPGIYHLPKPEPGAFERISVSFTPADGLLKEQLAVLSPICTVYNTTTEIHRICEDIFHECAEASMYQHEYLGTLLTQLMISNFRILQIGSMPQNNPKAGRNRYTDRIDDFFENHMEQGVTANDLADELHLSKRQLDRILKSYYGMGFREKLTCSRMDRASWILRNTDKPIYEIITDVGYLSEAAFYSVFKSHYSETPAAHRMKHRNMCESIVR